MAPNQANFHENYVGNAKLRMRPEFRTDRSTKPLPSQLAERLTELFGNSRQQLTYVSV